MRLSLGGWFTVVAQAQLHFASLGQWGYNNNDQRTVAQTLKAHAKRPPLSFLVSPGSNFVEGVGNLDDQVWKTHFEDVYESPELNLPFFVALGSQDWYANVTAMVQRTSLTYGKPLEGFDQIIINEPHDDKDSANFELNPNSTSPYQRQSSYRGPKWTLPNFFYHYTQSFPDATAATSFLAAPEVSAFFVFIDTHILQPNFLVDSVTTRHWNDLRQMLISASKTHDWIIAVGDQSVFSSGANGGSEWLKKTLRPIFRENLVDAYISGSDKSMEIIEDGSLSHIQCGSAGGSQTGKFTTHDGSLFFASKPGYCLHTLTSKAMVTNFVDGYSGKSLHEYSKLRNIRPKRFQDRLSNLNKIPIVDYVRLPPGIGGAPGGLLLGGMGRQPNKWFIILCGSFGLLCAAIVAITAMTTMTTRIKKKL